MKIFSTIIAIVILFSVLSPAEQDSTIVPPDTTISAQDSITTTTPSSESYDILEILFMIGYIGGVFILLPIVVYTNFSEKLFIPNEENKDKIKPLKNLSQEERNYRAGLILDRIAENMTPFTDDNGNDMITITKGTQARFTKKGIDYINKRLAPTDPNVIQRMEELADVYANRTQRAFTGSKWVIICGVAIAALFLLTAGIKTFFFIHTLGLIFYVLSSRTTIYGIEKRMNAYGGRPGFISGLMKSLFVGSGTRYYLVDNYGNKRRDWETEGSMAMVRIFFLVIVAAFLGLFAAFLGVINFVINYSTSFLLPFQSEDKWFAKHFSKIPAR